MEEFLPFIGMAAIFGIVMAFKASMLKNSARHWSRVASEFGLRFRNHGIMGGLEMSGTIDGTA